MLRFLGASILVIATLANTNNVDASNSADITSLYDMIDAFDAKVKPETRDGCISYTRKEDCPSKECTWCQGTRHRSHRVGCIDKTAAGVLSVGGKYYCNIDHTSHMCTYRSKEVCKKRNDLCRWCNPPNAGNACFSITQTKYMNDADKYCSDDYITQQDAAEEE